ncbi:MAG: hypothetical protein ACOYOP_12990 [Microthrixaceae bacterium]
MSGGAAAALTVVALLAVVGVREAVRWRGRRWRKGGPRGDR